MKQIKIVLLFLIGISQSLVGQDWSVSDIKVYDKFEAFEHLLDAKEDTIYLVNFWATWCGPCVKEMPYIQALHDSEFDVPVEILLVSLDFTKQLPTRVLDYLNSKKIRSDVVLLDDPKTNDWIDKVDPNWSGSIPITIIYHKGKRLFFEQEFHSTEELIDIINKIN